MSGSLGSRNGWNGWQVNRSRRSGVRGGHGTRRGAGRTPVPLGADLGLNANPWAIRRRHTHSRSRSCSRLLLHRASQNLTRRYQRRGRRDWPVNRRFWRRGPVPVGADLALSGNSRSVYRRELRRHPVPVGTHLALNGILRPVDWRRTAPRGFLQQRSSGHKCGWGQWRDGRDAPARPRWLLFHVDSPRTPAASAGSTNVRIVVGFSVRQVPMSSSLPSPRWCCVKSRLAARRARNRSRVDSRCSSLSGRCAG
jgi:hypothetical protein